MDATVSLPMKSNRRGRHFVRLAIPVVWAAGMFAARFDPRLAIGIVAALLIAAVMPTDAAPVGALLRPTLRLLVIAAFAAATMIAVTYYGFPAMVGWMSSLGRTTAELYARFIAGQPTAATLAFVVPLVCAEEILWRGAFQEALSPLRSPTARVVLAASIYAAAHLPFGSPLLAAVAFVCGTYWSALRAASGSLIPSLVAHLAWDIALIIVPLVLLH